MPRRGTSGGPLDPYRRIRKPVPPPGRSLPDRRRKRQRDRDRREQEEALEEARDPEERE